MVSSGQQDFFNLHIHVILHTETPHENQMIGYMQ